MATFTADSGPDRDRAHVAGYAARLGVAEPVVERRTAGGEGVSRLVFGTGPRFVFLHGAQLSAHTWNGVILRLGQPAMACDLPGHGHSARLAPADYRTDVMADRLARVIAAECRQSVVIVGHSFGGLCAIRVAHLLGAQAAGLFLIESSPDRIGDRRDTRPPLNSGTFQELVDAVQAQAPDRTRAAIERSLRMNGRERTPGHWEWLWDPAFIQAAPQRRAEGQAIWQALGALRCPCALAYGARSTAFDAQAAARMRQALPDLTVHCIEGGGHNLHTDAPAQVAALLESLSRCWIDSEQTMQRVCRR